MGVAILVSMKDHRLLCGDARLGYHHRIDSKG
jgi:hypothetical protein